MIGARLTTFNDNEAEQDANSALTELDKGLRSGKVGEQCEAIVRFPRLFEKYPFPILINSSFLKLADVFRMGNNFLRLWVLRVCQQSEKHLDKILNVDEFLRRVFSVLHSNDPVARALALRTLGAVAGIIPERQNVHHAIRRGLDSHDNVEVEAAIYATTRFAVHSNAFAVAMCNKLSDMVERESTGPERRAKLVRALRSVHGGAVRAEGVLKLLRSLLERFPSSSSVRATVTACTAIAAHTVIHVPDQVELLLSIATQDPRAAVRRAALLGLKRLAQHAALWPPACIDALVQAANDCSDSDHTMLCLEVMQILVQCPAVCAWAGSLAGAALMRHCANAALSPALRRAATATAVLTALRLHCYEESLPADGSELMLSLESLVIATGMPGNNDIKSLRIVLKCLVQLCNAEPTVYSDRTATVLGSQLQACDWNTERPRITAILEALGALGNSTHSPQTIMPAMPAILASLDDIPNRPAEGAEYGTMVVLLCTVIFQERGGTGLVARLQPAWEARVLAAVASSLPWTRYRLARAALRYGHHRLAAQLLSRLCAEAPSESAQRWLATLHRAAAADAHLVENGIKSLEECVSGWEVANSSEAAGGGACSAGCVGCGACTSISGSWTSARAAALSCLAGVATAARALCVQPPPATAHHHTQAGREPAAKSGACALALRSAGRAASGVARRYGAIARAAFHADDATITQLLISQQTYTQLAQMLERMTSSEEVCAELGAAPVKASTLEERIALAPYEAVATIAANLYRHPNTPNGITHRHAEAVLCMVRACAVGAVWPRDAFSGGSRAGLCRVSLTPPPRHGSAEHAAALPLSHHLALKVEGVILPHPHSRKRKQRQVKGVQLTVTATPHPRTNEKTVELTNIPPVLTAVQTVTPVRDFFSAQQLISVGAAGLYTVGVEASFVDQRGVLWNTGPRTAIVMKAHEDPSIKASVQNTRARF